MTIQAPKTRRTGTVERILTAAADLFYERGLRGVGVDQVIASSGVAKSTFYVHFRTKDELIAAYLTRTDESWRAQLREAAERAGDDPTAQVGGLFDALSEAFDRHGFFGCPFVNAGVETELDSQARAITVEHTRRRGEWLAGLARAAHAADADAVGRQLGLLIDGALAEGRLLQDRGVVDDARNAALALVGAGSTTTRQDAR